MANKKLNSHECGTPCKCKYTKVKHPHYATIPFGKNELVSICDCCDGYHPRHWKQVEEFERKEGILDE